jgi:hypothetical protein
MEVFQSARHSQQGQFQVWTAETSHPVDIDERVLSVEGISRTAREQVRNRKKGKTTELEPQTGKSGKTPENWWKGGPRPHEGMRISCENEILVFASGKLVDTIPHLPEALGDAVAVPRGVQSAPLYGAAAVAWRSIACRNPTGS